MSRGGPGIPRGPQKLTPSQYRALAEDLRRRDALRAELQGLTLEALGRKYGYSKNGIWLIAGQLGHVDSEEK